MKRWLFVVCAVALWGPSPVAAQSAADPVDSLAVVTESGTAYFIKGRGYGTDAYSGPFDVILNKGFAVAQWQDQDRHIFSYPYGWHAVWASVTRPGPAMERAGGWGTVLRRHVLPLSWDELRDGLRPCVRNPPEREHTHREPPPRHFDPAST